jgi:hypothetical protein
MTWWSAGVGIKYARAGIAWDGAFDRRGQVHLEELIAVTFRGNFGP